MRSLHPGACGFGDMRSRLLYIRDTRSVFSRQRANLAFVKNSSLFTVFPGKYSLPVEALKAIVELSKSLLVEVNNSTIELHLPVDSQYSFPVEALNLIVKSKIIDQVLHGDHFFSQCIQLQKFQLQKCFHSE